MPVCTDCGGTVIEYDQAAGNGFCVQCGTVVEENTIVSEVAFGETSNGAAMVQGSFVGQGATHARMSGPYGNRGSNESREQTIANANKKIQSIANILRLSEVVCLAATRLYTLAVEHKFTKGRKSMNVVAVCLYVACRQKETRNYMLIDFSDLLQVNVFELGHTYLQLVQTLNLRLPLVDPSHYISLATDAVRLVQRFDRDWMTRGRRPAGICGAALLLAARMNNFRRSIEEIVQVVKIADTTLKKRLDEFKATPSGALTLADFRNVWLDEEMDPPAFTKGKEREEAEKLAAEQGKAKAKKNGKKRKGKRKRGEDTEEEEMGVLTPPPMNLVDETVSEVLAEEVSTFLHGSQGARLAEALDEAEQRRLAQISVIDELMGLNEGELDRFILSEEEVRIKERVWVELNKDYLEAIAGDQGDQDTSSTSKSKKRRKTNNKPRDASTAAGDTAAESVRNLIKKNPKYSKRINYDALKDLFVENDADLYTMDDDKSDGEGVLGMPTVIVEEEPGTVALKPASEPTKSRKKGVLALQDMDMDADGEADEGSDEDKDEDIGWEDAYEQEV
ncbi:Brf1-like TBP-binding domain-containing protein [Flammula alnicola]|nr:Brf1-like TBP-binding domain-containing protein [Flammula alnicola]